MMRVRQNGPFKKFMQFFILHSSVSCIVMYGALSSTNLCDQCLTRIIHIDKTRAEKHRFAVFFPMFLFHVAALQGYIL